MSSDWQMTLVTTARNQAGAKDGSVVPRPLGENNFDLQPLSGVELQWPGHLEPFDE